MKIVADRDRCIGAGMCTLIGPELFAQADDDGRVLLLQEQPGSEYADTAREAVDVCPSGALSLDRGVAAGGSAGA